MLSSPGDIAFTLFGVPVYYYGIIISLAVFAGFCVANYLYKKYYDDTNLILDISPYLIIIGIIGARLYYCLVNYSYYIHKPLEIFFIRQGGLSIHGMIIAGALALLYFSKKYKVPFLRLTDVFLCGTILAQSIGRWGNFFNSEAFGLPCDLPWKLYIPISHRPLGYINYEYFHPTFLYESLLDLGIFVVLMIVAKHSGKLKEESGKLNNFQLSTFNFQPDKDLSPCRPIALSPDKPGIITSLYLILYAIARILVEQLRIDSALNLFGIPIAQVVSFLMIIAGFFLLYNISIKKRPN